MNKRITSLLLCFVMVFAMLATAVPVFAAPIESTQLKVIPDKTEASPGDIITYSVVLGPVSDMGTMQMYLVIPTGLTYVEDSGKLADNLKSTLGFDDTAWTEKALDDRLKITGVASAADYESAKDTPLATFQCKVEDGATGTLEVGLDNLEFYSCKTWEDHTDRFSVVKTPVTITAAPKPATDIKLNKSATTIYTGNTETLVATVEPSDTTDTVVWTSSKESVATVDNTGKVTAVAPGTATITAKAGDKTATCTVTVENAPCTHTDKTNVDAKPSTCTEQGWDEYQKCTLCGARFNTSGDPIEEIPYRALNDDHDFDTATWSYQGADGHAHVCTRNPDHKDGVVPHTSSGSATETEDEVCTVCGYVITPATGHVCANHLTKVEEKLADCTNPGNIEHYKCSCGKLYEDATATVEITDHSTVVVPALGHDWAEATCTQPKTCQRCDATEGEALGHDWEEEWNTDETNHWHACTRCDATADLAAHIPDHEGGATMDYPILCTVCGHMMEKQLEPITLQIQLPFQLTVKQTDEMAPGPQTFQFVAEEFGAPVDYVMVNDTVETNGVKTYEGVYSFTITDMDWGNLSEGFRFRQVKGSAEGWTYDETAYYAVPESWGNDVTVSQWTFYPLTAEGYPDYDNPVEEMVFVNSYAAKKPVEPTPSPKPSEAPKPTQTLKPVQPPQTGDHSQLILWATLLVVSGAVGMALVSQKRRKNAK